jgi:putative zinc finger/helix-turn-helix YgiT family protein
MKCLECGTVMATRRGRHQYRQSGLSGVTLDGVEIRECPHCGAREVAIPRIEQLHHLIASHVIHQTASLSPAEVRFLRKYLGWSATDFAARMRTTRETVSRWENGKTAMRPQADQLLRWMVATLRPVEDYGIEGLLNLSTERSRRTPHRFGVRLVRSTWAVVPA